MIFFYLLVSIMPLTRHPIWGRVVGDLTMTKYVGVASFLYAVFYLFSRRSLPAFFRSAQARWFTVLYFLAAISYVTKGTTEDWQFSPFVSYTLFFVFFLVTLSVVDSLRRLRLVLLVAVGSVGFASLYVLREWQKFHSFYDHFRPGWVVGDPNYFTVSALLCLPLAFFLAMEKRPRWERLFCLGCLSLTLLAVTLAASRGGLLGLVTAFLFVVWHSQRRIRNLAVIAALVIPLGLFAPASPIERFLNPSRGDQEATDTRIALYKAGLRMTWENPVQGVGLGNFKRMTGQYSEVGEDPSRIAHNSYIEVAAEMGIPGLLALLAVLMASFRTLRQVRRQTARSGPALLHLAALGIQAGLLGCAVSIFFVSGQYQKLLWLMIFISMCLPPLLVRARLQQKQLEAQSETVSLGNLGGGSLPARQEPTVKAR